MIETTNKSEVCPVREALKVIGGKWRLQVVYVLANETKRFGVIKRSVPSISEKVLIQELKHLVKHGMLKRKAYPEVPPRVEYSLTQKGKELLPIIDQIERFGNMMIKEN